MTMRITGGIWRGRQLRVPPHGVRPAQDRVRLAVFSALGDRIGGARVLDLFAGTGAYGLEALSRGAASAVWIESDRLVTRYLRENVAALCGGRADFDREQALVCCCDCLRYLSGAEGRCFDVFFADPPYDPAQDWSQRIVAALSGCLCASPGAWLVLEQAAAVQAPSAPGWRFLKNRIYGATAICYYAKIS